MKRLGFIFSILLFVTFCSCSGNDFNFDFPSTLPPDSIFNENSSYVVVIGDVQVYTSNDHLNRNFVQTLDWIRCQENYFNNISCVLQVGDLTENNITSQWNRVEKALEHLSDSILFIPVTGNHDYTWDNSINQSEIKDRNSTQINILKNLSHLKAKSSHFFEEGRIDNIIVPIFLNNKTIYVIAIEFGHREEVIEWAKSIVESNQDNDFILLTHEWLTLKGERIKYGSYASWQLSNLSHSTPEEIWTRLVYPNDNVLCVLCGHNGFCKYLFSPNIQGREVCQILFNLQYQDNGGDGMVQLGEFPENDNVINISVFNTFARIFHPNIATRIKIQL